jgi:hypothetical protein
VPKVEHAAEVLEEKNWADYNNALAAPKSDGAFGP